MATKKKKPAKKAAKKPVKKAHKKKRRNGPDGTDSPA